MPFRFDIQSYPPPLAELLESAPPVELGAGHPNRSALDQLESLTLANAFAGQTIFDERMASCCLSGVWLMHHFLDQSHTISQSIDTPEGSYWHGLMHRREGDFSNAKYWFRRVGPHQLWDTLGSEASAIAAEVGTDHHSAFLTDQPSWNPFDFVDLCQQATRGSSREGALCRQIAQCERELLFDYCYQQAIGRESTAG